ncbi:MFS transporter [Ferruginibacter sp. HRS2-29]|uniref:MFS transporter n=1 Tax=Ferruginibacter sp. HRS2-29 TaxID=2487334 RepID=UPI0020CBE02A|nr:MFS transporter [Ferruginibacter sp. HRS2-29]MCP9752541.1 MFS transporter [Ferruginibacter sp. HRS2-29]
MQTASKKVINGWAMYDWANSVYNLVITTTFFPAYYAAVTGLKKYPDGITFLGRTFVNTELKDYVLAFGFLVIAILSPILSSIADYKGNKKNFMRFFCYLGAASCSLMFFFDENNVTLGLMCFMFAGIGFYGSQVFYNSYLPEISSEKDMDRISAKGYTMGYIGSVIMQMIGFALVMFMPAGELPLKLTFLLVGIWWVVFAQVTFNALPMSTRSERQSRTNVFSNGFLELKKVWAQVIKMPVLKRYLTAFFFYSMGVQTVMLVAIDFGIKELKLANDKLIITAVIIQLVAIAGAIMMSKLSEKYGNVRVLIFTVLLWIGVCITGYFISTEMHFYILASLVGLVMGGIQSLSRSTYSKLMPETKDTASFFSFYDVTEKFAIVIGLFTFGFIEGISTIRESILSLVVFFALGFIFLLLTSAKQRSHAADAV